MNVSTLRPMKLQDWGLIVILATIWGAAYPFIEVAVAELPPFTIALVRVFLASVMLSTWAALSGQGLWKHRQYWLTFLMLGTLNNAVPFTLIVWVQSHITGGLASILNATTPLFALMIAHVFTRDERLNARKLGGVAIGMSGVAVLIGVDALSDVGSYIPAELAALAASLCYATGGIVTRRRLGVFPPLVTAQGQLWSATFLLLPLTCFIDRPWAGPVPSVPVIASLVGLAALSTALAYVIYFRLVNNVGATSALLVTLLIPIAALTLGTVLLGETLTLNQAAGMLLIFSGLAVIDGRVGAWLGGLFRRVP